MAPSRTDRAERNGANTDQIEGCAEGNIRLLWRDRIHPHFIAVGLLFFAARLRLQ
jgi:hypothetical protein